MTACEIAESTLEPLRQVVDAEHLSILLGAGASIAAGLPTWDDLAVRLLASTETIPDASAARGYLTSQDASLVAEAARANAQDWGDSLRRALYSENPPGVLEPTVMHAATAALALQRLPQVTALFTLNFDLLLENQVDSAFAEAGREERSFSRATDSPRAPDDRVEVTHLHGIIPASGDPIGVVLTLSEINAVAKTAHPWQASALQEALTRGPMILAGTSYRDADIRQWLHSIERSGGDINREVYVVVAREGLGLSTSQFQSTHDPIVQQWQSIGLTPIITSDFADAAQCLWELPHLGSSGYEVPAVRTQALWARLSEEFEPLQMEFSDTLAENLPTFRDVLPGSLNLTLWCADGSGSAVRFASPDRMYRSVDALRRVPTGFDSAWLAGRCIGRSETVSAADDPAASSRWPTLLVSPVVANRPNGPDLCVGALSVAADGETSEPDQRHAATLLDQVAQDMGDRLSEL